MVCCKIRHPLFVEGDPGWMVGRAIRIGYCNSPGLDNLRQHVKDVVDFVCGGTGLCHVREGAEGQAWEKNDSEQ
jgi:hypothetical protein